MAARQPNMNTARYARFDVDEITRSFPESSSIMLLDTYFTRGEFRGQGVPGTGWTAPLS
jgi:hypothetical protein